jgi:serine protease SohB
MLDPFLPENPGDVERLKNLQRQIHDSFIALVKSRRGGKLNGPENDLFSGEYWTGTRGMELGLVDGIGDLRSVLRQRFGDKIVTPLISAERGWLGRRLAGVGRGDLVQGLPAGLVGGLTAGFAADLISALEARAMWARFGL